MICTFLPVTDDGHLYAKDEDIRKYTPCLVLTKKELKELKRLYGLAHKIKSCPVIGEMLYHPVKMDRDYNRDMKAGSYIAYLYKNMSRRAASMIRQRKGVLNAFLQDLEDFMYANARLVCCDDSILLSDKFDNALDIVLELSDASDPYYDMLCMLERK